MCFGYAMSFFERDVNPFFIIILMFSFFFLLIGVAIIDNYVSPISPGACSLLCKPHGVKHYGKGACDCNAGTTSQVDGGSSLRK